jgi:hypothetical protein
MNGSRKKRKRKLESELVLNPGVRLGSFKGEPVHWAISRFMQRRIKLALCAARPSQNDSSKNQEL